MTENKEDKRGSNPNSQKHTQMSNPLITAQAIKTYDYYAEGFPYEFYLHHSCKKYIDFMTCNAEISVEQFRRHFTIVHSS